MEQMLHPQFYVAELDAARGWLTANAFLLSVSTIGQMIVVIGAFLGAAIRHSTPSDSQHTLLRRSAP